SRLRGGCRTDDPALRGLARKRPDLRQSGLLRDELRDAIFITWLHLSRRRRSIGSRDLGLYGTWKGFGSSHTPKRSMRRSRSRTSYAAALYRRAKVGLNLYRTSMGFRLQRAANRTRRGHRRCERF